MKKIISVVLTVALLITVMLPLSVSAVDTATISATATTTLEIESYVDSITKNADGTAYVPTPNACTGITDKLSGGLALRNTYTSIPGGYTVTVPVNVEETGKYKLSVIMTLLGNTAQSGATVSVDGAQLFQNTATYKASERLFYWSDHGLEFFEFAGSKILTAGTHTVTINVANREADPTQIMFVADCMKFEPVANASVSSTETTKLEMENYVDSVTKNSDGSVFKPYAHACDGITDKLSGGLALRNTYQVCEGGYTINVPVNVSATGKYKISVLMSEIADAYSGATVSVDGAALFKNTESYRATANRLFAWDAHGFWFFEYTGSKVMTEGTHLITINVANRVADPTQIMFVADYIKFEPVANASVSSTETTTLEMENYVDSVTNNADGSVFKPSASNCDDIGLSGGKGLRNTYQVCAGGYTVNVPVNVSATGKYKISVMMTEIADAYSGATVSVDGVALFQNAEAYRSSERKLVWAAHGFWFYEYAGTKLLTEGTHLITINVSNRAADPTQIMFVADYMKFEPELPAEISDEEMTTLEMEDYVDSVTKNVDGSVFKPSASTCDDIGLSGGKGLRNTYQTCEGGYTVTVPVNVAEAGKYTVTVCMTDYSSTTSKAAVAVDGTVLFDNTATYRTGERTHTWSNMGLLFYDYAGDVVLTAGPHTVTINVANREADTTQILFVADCLKFEPEEKKAPAAVLASDTTTIELENWVDSVTKNSDGSVFTPSASPCDDIGLSGGYGLRNTYQSCEGGYTVTIPVNVSETGVYTLTALMTDYSASTSKATVSVDGNALFQNTAEYRTTADRKLTWGAQGLLFYDYAGDVVLTAGPHTVTINVANREADITQILFVGDYLKFTPAAKATINEANSEAAVTACYSDAVSGKAIIACYAGGRMVGCADYEINGTSITNTVSYSAKPDEIKVLVWGDFTKLIPLVSAKVIEVQ